jgi:hypothetical protein
MDTATKSDAFGITSSEGPLEARSPQTLKTFKRRFFEVEICVQVQDTKADACKLAS